MEHPAAVGSVRNSPPRVGLTTYKKREAPFLPVDHATGAEGPSTSSHCVQVNIRSCGSEQFLHLLRPLPLTRHFELVIACHSNAEHVHRQPVVLRIGFR